jgi:hypothetical protein
MDIKIIFFIALECLLALAIYKYRKRKAISNFILFCFVGLLALLLVEFGYRNFFGERKIISSVNNYYKTDTVVGFHFDPGKITAIEHFERGDTLYNTHYTILPDSDTHGFAYPMRMGYKAESGDSEIVFMGCSFTLGEGLDDDQTLAYQYGRLTNTNTLIRACNGLGTHQVYTLFKEKYSNRDNNGRVFVYSFFSQHLFRALGLYSWNIAGPRYVLAGDSLVNKGPWYRNRSSISRLPHYASFLGTFTFIRDKLDEIVLNDRLRKITAEDIAPMYAMIVDMAASIRRSGGKLIILDWNAPGVKTGSNIVDKDIEENKVAKLIAPFRGQVLRVSAVIGSQPQFYIPHDGHPSALANKVLAQYLAQNIK